jgi:mycothiol synthase
MVQNFVDAAENEEYGRQRGYTEGICVRRPWRRQGLAKALIARSFHLIKDLGMTEAALGVDAQNPNGALQLYRSMGFQVVKRHTTYQKVLDLDA